VRTVYHLIFDVLPESGSFSQLRTHVDYVNDFMKAKGIALQSKPVIVSATNEFSGLFILMHHLDHHVTKLLESSRRRNPQFTAADLASDVLKGLKDEDILTMLKKRSHFIGSQAGLNVTPGGFSGRMSDNFITQSNETPKQLAAQFVMYVMDKAQELVSRIHKQR
jgi:hypothetical protein